jgi:flagellar hook assembly protein FlgD
MAPNPFNGGTVVRIEMVHTGSAQLDIYDVRGRRVRRLSDDGRTLAPGLHEFPWDGRNNRGHYVSSGVYFVRLSAGGEVESGKLVLVK